MRRRTKLSMLMIQVVLEILLNSIVCFLQFSSSYIQIRGIIKVAILRYLLPFCSLYRLKIINSCLLFKSGVIKHGGLSVNGFSFDTTRLGWKQSQVS